MNNIFEIPNYSCPACGYTQDFDPNDPDLMALHFPGVEVGHCPACATGKNPIRRQEAVVLEYDISAPTIMTIKTPLEVEQALVEYRSRDGEELTRPLDSQEKAVEFAKIDQAVIDAKQTQADMTQP